MGKFRLNYLLVVLCIARATLTIYSQFDVALIPSVPVIDNLSIKLNDVVVVGIWVLITGFCGFSIAGLYGILGLKSFRDLFFDIFYSRENQCLGLLGRSMVVLAVLLTGASASYIPRLIYFIYVEWTSGFDPLVQTLQMYPALLMVVQTLYQGTFLLRAYSKPSSLMDIAKTNMDNCKAQLEANTALNLTLLLHCICISAVIEICVIEKDIVLQLAVGEMVYRLWAVVAFLYLKWKIEQCSDTSDEQPEEAPTVADVTNIEDRTVHMTSSSKAPLENDSTESTGPVNEDEVEPASVNTPLETSSTKDPNGHDEIDKSTASVYSDIASVRIIVQATEDEDCEQNYSKLVMQSLCKEVQQFFESGHDQDLNLVTPQQCSEEEPSRDACAFVVPKTPNKSGQVFESGHDQYLNLATPQLCSEAPSRDTCTFVVPKTPNLAKF